MYNLEKKPIKNGKPAKDNIMNEKIILNNVLLFKKIPIEVILSIKTISLLSSFLLTKTIIQQNIQNINNVYTVIYKKQALTLINSYKPIEIIIKPICTIEP